MSLDGIEYFPQEFASSEFIDNMFSKQKKQVLKMDDVD